ncbi:hypothetical protein K449DRAFT_394550 [Hypoxylon sp. EC38]|nr:hypothetical protein K449DRAFT_394550 [Hypoxylon sp. EC38]
MESLDLISWAWDESLSRGVGFANGNVWSRSYRRKRARGYEITDLTSEGATKSDISCSREDKVENKTKQHIAKCAFGFAITIMVLKASEDDEDQITVTARWLQGSEYALFESLTGLLRNSIRVR